MISYTSRNKELVEMGSSKLLEYFPGAMGDGYEAPWAFLS